MSRMTVVSVGSDEIIEKITKQLNKLVEVSRWSTCRKPSISSAN